MSIAQNDQAPTDSELFSVLRNLAESFHGLHQSMEAMRAEAASDRAAWLRWMESTDGRFGELRTRMDTRLDVVWSEIDALRADVDRLLAKAVGDA